MYEVSIHEYSQSSSGVYDSDEVHSLPIIFSQDTFSFQLEYQDPIRILLESSFMDRYPFHSIRYIMHYVSQMSYDLILSFFTNVVIQI